MHPNPLFRAKDRDLLADAVAIGFAHIFAGTPDGPMVVHVPVTAAGDHLRFHVARKNRIAAHLDGAAILASFAGPDGYVSPSWYAAPRDQVPTWNYVAVEVDGVARALSSSDLIDQLDTLAAVHEPRVAPIRPWTRGQTDPTVIAKLMAAIQGFELHVTAIRGTTKLSQNRRDADRAGVIAGLRACGNDALAGAMEA